MFVCHCPQALKDEHLGQLPRFIVSTQEWLQQTSGPPSAYCQKKNWLESIVLKQKSIAFGSCPRKFNELIFKAPFSLDFNSIAPGAPQICCRWEAAPLHPLGVPPCSSPGPRTSHGKAFRARVSAQHRSAQSPWGKGTQCWFSRGREAEPSLPVRGPCPYWIS